jgi:hypothetical protein
MTTLVKMHFSQIICVYARAFAFLCVPVHIVKLFFYACISGKSLQILSEPPAAAAAAAAQQRLAWRAPNSLSAALSSCSYYSCPGARFLHTKPREGVDILGLSYLIPPPRADRLPGG